MRRRVRGTRLPKGATPPCHCRRRFWPAALLAEIPLSIPVVGADGEGALTIIIIGGMPRMRRRS
jgi:hypothetical protein